MDYTGTKDGKGIAGVKKPSKSPGWKGVMEKNICRPTSSTPKGGNTNPAYPKVTKPEGR